MIRVVVIGSGNVAQHLIKVFNDSKGIEVVQVFSRTPAKLYHLLPTSIITDSYQNLPEADIYIIAVTDNAIGEVALSLPFKGRLVVHTSGSVDMLQPDPKNRRGVFYPLQTFSKNKEVDFSSVPVCIESEHAEDYILLEKLGRMISDVVYPITSLQRRALHVAAVFVANFTNHMYHLGSRICAEHTIPFGLLQPLIQETAGKVQHLSPGEAQTGPAVRKDSETIARHLEMLRDDNMKDIYSLLTKSIQGIHDKEL